jgi:hypothetical protein
VSPPFYSKCSWLLEQISENGLPFLKKYYGNPTMPHSRQTQVLDQKIHWIPILETTCNTSFLCPSLKKRVVIWLYFTWAKF